MSNLARLFLDQADRHPEARYGVIERPTTLAQTVDTASLATGMLAEAGVLSGSRCALIGETSTSYLTAFVTLQLAGVEPALINPALPDDLIRQMLDGLGVSSVLWVNRRRNAQVAPSAVHLDGSGLDEGRIYSGEQPLEGHRSAVLDGLQKSSGDIAAYMHTSGTTGAPKFCAQSHRYFLSLGRWVADSMAISSFDTVFAPLSMFHINPLGYGLLGGLTGGAAVLGTQKFSARGFWPAVKDNGVSVVFLHGPPVAILNKATSEVDASGHSLRAVFLADAAFLQKFRVPMAFSGYGSTEAAGLTHIWPWRRGDTCPHSEGMSRYGGRARPDLDWDISPDGEILIRERETGVLASGYQTVRGLQRLCGEDGWFRTGDLGRRDEQGNLIFIDRRSESIRVKGEYVPIHYVEQVFSEIESLKEVALWRRPGELGDHEVVLYVACEKGLPKQEIMATASQLAPFMRPVEVRRVAALPRTEGVGKVSRRELPDIQLLESMDLSGPVGSQGRVP